ncbi:MAG: dihydrofolate reductase family protein [Pseudomonadota bacterium]
MRRIVYDVAVSLDGFIAGVGDDISAFPAEGDHVDAYRARLESYDTAIMGRRTYEFGYRFGLAPGAKAYPHMTHYIFSSTLDLPEPASVTVVRDGWADFVREIKTSDGGDIYLCGGGRFAGFLAREALIDVLRLKIAPAVIGSGVPLFEGLGGALSLTRTVFEPHASGVILAEYTVDNG